MLNVIPFHVDHLRELRLQPAQAHCADAISEDILAQHANLEAYTACQGYTVIAVAGLMEFWPGRSMGWSYLSRDAGPYMLELTRLVKKFFSDSPVRRIEVYVDPAFEAAMRWAVLLGLESEGLLRGFLPDGRDQQLFARVNNHG